MLKSYKTLLTYIRSAVSRNVSEKAITNLIEKVSGAGVDFDLLKKFYDMTLDALLDIKNDRFWFKTKLKVGKLYSDREQYDELEQIISELKEWCKTDDGTNDMKKGTQLLEICALEIQMYTSQKNNKKLRVCSHNITSI